MTVDLVRHWAYVAARRGHFAWSTPGGYFRCLLCGIELGPGCRFHGRARFRRYPGSRIVLGNDCTLLSSAHSNLIGINRPCMISTHAPDAEVRIGNGCGFSGTVVAAFTSIVLGEHVICGANTLITDSNWHPEDPRSGSPEPVRIGDNVWLGANVTVLKGVTIGRNAVVGTGSIVTGDIPANTVARARSRLSLDPLDEDLIRR